MGRTEDPELGRHTLEIPANTHGVFTAGGSDIGVFDTIDAGLAWTLTSGFPPSSNMILTMTMGQRTPEAPNYLSGNGDGGVYEPGSVLGTWYGTVGPGVRLFLNIDSPPTQVLWVWSGGTSRVPRGRYSLRLGVGPTGAAGDLMERMDALIPTSSE